MVLKLKNKQEVDDTIKNLTTGLDSSQINLIVNFATYRWCEEYYQDVLDKIKEIQNNIKTYSDYLKNHDKITAIYIDELNQLKKKIK